MPQGSKIKPPSTGKVKSSTQKKQSLKDPKKGGMLQLSFS